MKKIKVNGIRLVIKERSLSDMMAIQGVINRAGAQYNSVVIAAHSLSFAIINKRFWLLKWTGKRILRTFSIAQISEIVKAVEELESHGVKKKNTTSK